MLSVDPATPSAATQLVKIRVLTINLHKGFNVFNRKFVLPELKTAICQVGADIVFLQEVIGANALHAKRYSHWPTVSQYEYLADSVWSEFAYGCNAVYPGGHHGNALLSKFPIVMHRNIDVSHDGSEQRGILHCELALPGARTSIHAMCIHLGLREKQRQHQLDLLLALIASLPADAAVIIAGDFNDWRLVGNARLLRDHGLTEIFARVYGTPAPTFPARWPVLKLDRIYTRNLFASRPLPLSQRPWAHLSDHAPLAGELTLSIDQASTTLEALASDRAALAIYDESSPLGNNEMMQ
jgi:endonuclease/exonuclease/phosphatase family metal-dependent hydrolase